MSNVKLSINQNILQIHHYINNSDIKTITNLFKILSIALLFATVDNGKKAIKNKL